MFINIDRTRDFQITRTNLEDLDPEGILWVFACILRGNEVVTTADISHNLIYNAEDSKELLGGQGQGRSQNVQRFIISDPVVGI